MAKDEKAPYFYRPERLAIAFGIVFFLCLGFVAWATFDDHSREWKETQRAFRTRMVERLDRRLEAQAAASDSTALAEVEAHPSEIGLQNALEELSFFTSSVHIMGVYPAHPFRAESTVRGQT